MQIKLSTTSLQRIIVFGAITLTLGCAQNAGVLQGQKEIKQQLADIKELINEIPKPKKAKPFKPSNVSIADSPFLGKEDAQLTLIEFTDYQCPFCKRHVTRTMPEIMKEYVDTGKVKYVLREFPLKSIHPNAAKLSQAALCAGDQGKYWEMHDLFFKGKSKPNPKDLSAEVGELGLDAALFNTCLESNKHAKKVSADISDGAKLGVRGTPSFFLGETKSGSNTVKATVFLKGAIPFSKFKKEIDKLLK